MLSLFVLAIDRQRLITNFPAVTEGTVKDTLPIELFDPFERWQLIDNARREQQLAGVKTTLIGQGHGEMVLDPLGIKHSHLARISIGVSVQFFSSQPT